MARARVAVIVSISLLFAACGASAPAPSPAQPPPLASNVLPPGPIPPPAPGQPAVSGRPDSAGVAESCKGALVAQLKRVIAAWYLDRQQLDDVWGANATHQSGELADAARTGAGQMTVLDVQLQQAVQDAARRARVVRAGQRSSLRLALHAAAPSRRGLTGVAARAAAQDAAAARQKIRDKARHAKMNRIRQERAAAWQPLALRLLRTGLERSTFGLERLSVAYQSTAVGDVADFADGANALEEADQLVAQAKLEVENACGQ